MNETILMMMLQAVIAIFMAVGIVGVYKKNKRNGR